MKEYFEQFGEVVDVFIPKPFRAFAFVTFSDPLVAERLCGEDHIIKTASVHISTAEPKAKDGQDRQGHRGGGGENRMAKMDVGAFGGKPGMPGMSGMPGQWRMNQRQPDSNVGMEPNMNNIGMNMISTAMLAAAQAMFQGTQNSNSSSYELGPGFGGTRDSRNASGTFPASNWNSGDSASGQNSYSQWGNRSGGGGGYNNNNSSGSGAQGTTWGQGASGRGNWS